MANISFIEGSGLNNSIFGKVAGTDLKCFLEKARRGL